MTLSTEQLLQNYDEVCQRIQRTAQQLQCPAPALLAVSKTKPADMVETLYQHGQRDFGENYLQDALEKIQALSHLDIQWHFIGQIQSNKTRVIAEHFHWVHSVDRLKIARRLNEQRPSGLPPLNVCLQVNLDEEAQKGGFSPEALLEEAIEIDQLDNLCLKGLMCIPKPRDNAAGQTAVFARLSVLQQQLNRQGLQLDTLSMGMSNDMESAMAAGSTMLRIGTDIFGARTL